MLKMIQSTPFDECLTCSVAELADSLEMDYITAQGFVKFGVASGFVKLIGVRKKDGQRGKPTNLYAVPIAVQLSFHEEMKAVA